MNDGVSDRPPLYIWTRREYEARRIAARIYAYQRAHGRPPTVRELREMGMTGGSSGIMQRLEDAAALGLLITRPHTTARRWSAARRWPA